MQEYILAVDIGGTKILTGIIARNGQILLRLKEPICMTGNPQEVMMQISRMAEQMMRKLNIEPQDIIGVGAGVPGPLDYEKGIVEDSPNLRWKKFMIREALSKCLGLRLMLDKDTNVAAWAEKVYGTGRDCSHFIYMTISTGIGGGIFTDGKILHGRSGGASEIGHMMVEPNGRKCGCGRCGCLEAVASGTALSLDAQELIKQGGGEKIAALCSKGQAATPYELGMAARQGDPEALKIIRRAADYLAIGTANLVNIFNPEKVIIGGGVGTGLQDLLLPRIRDYVNASVFSLHRRNLSIEATPLGEDIVLLGCAAMVLAECKI